MTTENRYLFSLIESIIPIYKSYAHTAAIALTGSVARGQTDRYSDIDLLVYYNTLPEQEVIESLRQQIPHYTPGDYHVIVPGAGCAEYFYLHGVRCDIAHTTVEKWESMLDEVLNGKDTQLLMQKAVGGILDAKALYDEHGYLSIWKEKAALYPQFLREKMVKEHLTFYPAWIMEFMAAGRGDMLWYRELLLNALKNILAMLMGVNKIYHQADFKHLDATIAKMSFVPPQLSRLLNEVFIMSPHDAVAEVLQLLHETLDLVEQHLPEVDTRRLRSRLALDYKGWDIPPDFC